MASSNFTLMVIRFHPWTKKVRSAFISLLDVCLFSVPGKVRVLLNQQWKCPEATLSRRPMYEKWLHNKE